MKGAVLNVCTCEKMHFIELSVMFLMFVHISMGVQLVEIIKLFYI